MATRSYQPPLERFLQEVKEGIVRTWKDDIAKINRRLDCLEPCSRLAPIASPIRGKDFARDPNVAALMRGAIEYQNSLIPDGKEKYIQFPANATDKKLNTDAKDALEVIMIEKLGESYGSLNWATVSKTTHSAACEAVVRTAAASKDFVVFRQSSNLWCIRWLAEQKMKSKRRPPRPPVREQSKAVEHNNASVHNIENSMMRTPQTPFARDLVEACMSTGDHCMDVSGNGSKAPINNAEIRNEDVFNRCDSTEYTPVEADDAQERELHGNDPNHTFSTGQVDIDKGVDSNINHQVGDYEMSGLHLPNHDAPSTRMLAQKSVLLRLGVCEPRSGGRDTEKTLIRTTPQNEVFTRLLRETSRPRDEISTTVTAPCKAFRKLGLLNTNRRPRGQQRQVGIAKIGASSRGMLVARGAVRVRARARARGMGRGRSLQNAGRRGMKTVITSERRNVHVSEK